MEKKQLTITISKEQEREIERLRQEQFFGKNDEEVFRCLIKEGLEVCSKGQENLGMFEKKEIE